MVALVTAIRSSSGIGIAAAVRLASTNRASSARWPLSWPRARLVLCLRPAQTVAFLKLSSRALRPPPAASNVSFGKRVLPAVTIADDAARTVPESHGHLDVIFLGAGNGVDLLGKAARPPAQRVDEVAAFPGEA